MALEPGTLLEGKYRIGTILGQGGMGVVHAALHEALGRPVAVKVLNPGGNARAVARLRREAQILARIDNAHVCKVYDVGSLEDGSPFVVMEYLEGYSLADRPAARPSVGQVVHWIAQACEGLAEAHRHAIVHRDLKPANLFVTQRPDGDELLKLLDFGVAKPLDDEDLQSITADEALVGSPRFMSPEQVQSSKDVDARSDIWSLGLVMYELLAGEKAFAGRSLAEYFIAIVMDEPVPLSQRREGLPSGLEEVLGRCLAKQREDRYATIGDFAKALTPFAEPRSLASLERASRPVESSTTTPAIDPEASMTREHDVPLDDPLEARSKAGPPTLVQQPVTLPGAPPDIEPVVAPPAPVATAKGPQPLWWLGVATILVLGGLLFWSVRDREGAIEGAASVGTSSAVPATPPTMETEESFETEAAIAPSSPSPVAEPSQRPPVASPSITPPPRPSPAPRPRATASPPTSQPDEHLPDLGI